jgi:hypothetical protein
LIVLSGLALPLPSKPFPTMKGGDQQLIKSIPFKGNFFTTDPMGNMYLVDGYSLSKLDSNGIFLCSYSSLLFGAISSVDASIPQKILVFYKENGMIIQLDDKLAELSKTGPFQHKRLETSTLVCGAFDGGLWFFESQENRLVKLNPEFSKVIAESPNIAQLLKQRINPVFMLESGGKLYMSDPNTGIYVFDSFGAYIQTLPLKDIPVFQVLDDQLIYFLKDKLHIRSPKLVVDKTVSLPTTTLNARLSPNRMFIQGSKSIEIRRRN